jgi:hypothetical protein
MMRRQTKRFVTCEETGVALVIVLAFVVLLTGIVVAYLSRSSTQRQVSHTNFSDTKADELARGALDVIVGDLKQEIFDGSNASTINGSVIYTPKQPSYILPTRSGNPVSIPDPIPNLVRRSVRSDPIPVPGKSSHASAINSTTDLSRNGRAISSAQWNKHYLIPRPAGANPTDTTSVASFVAPDWVIVTGSGPDAAASTTSNVIGRYALSIYDEGGLIDVNVGGFPPSPNTTVAQSGPKGLLSFADLTVFGMSTSAASDLVGWRNYASAQPGGVFAAFTFDPTSATNYYNAVLPVANDFLKTSTVTYNAKTDQKFINRQMLIQYRSAGGINFSADAMQYLGTFSRDANVATWNNLQIGRFLLSKLDEVKQPPGAGPSDPAAVRRDFGLVWNVDHWDYYGPTGGSLAASIGTFVSSNPEFFQLLNSAIPGRTIGQILALGASIIDQNDTDLVTTIIEYAGGPPNPRAYGADTNPAPSPAPTPPAAPFVLNRALRNAGELGYAYTDIVTNKTVDLFTAATQEASLLDLFSYTSASTRAGAINLNSRNSVALAAMIGGAIEAQPLTTISTARAKTAATALVNATAASPALSRQDIGRLTAAISGSLSAGEEKQEALSRALSEACQTRTWNLMIDVIAQSGRYPPAAANLADFIVEGEKRYWLHVAIDRFTGEVVDQQLETVYE